MNVWYPLTLEKLCQGLIDLDGGTVMVRALDSSYVYDPAHEFLDDTTGALGTDDTLAGKDFTGGVWTATPNPSITGVNAPDVVVAVLYYIDTGVTATSPLILFNDGAAGGGGINYPGDGNPITIALPSGRVATL